MLAKLKEYIGISIAFMIVGAYGWFCGWLVGKYSD